MKQGKIIGQNASINILAAALSKVLVCGNIKHDENIPATKYQNKLNMSKAITHFPSKSNSISIANNSSTANIVQIS